MDSLSQCQWNSDHEFERTYLLNSWTSFPLSSPVHVSPFILQREWHNKPERKGFNVFTMHHHAVTRTGHACVPHLPVADQFRVLSIENEVIITRFGECGMMGCYRCGKRRQYLIKWCFVLFISSKCWSGLYTGTAIVAVFSESLDDWNYCSK
jgi:hypothetical protein